MSFLESAFKNGGFAVGFLLRILNIKPKKAIAARENNNYLIILIVFANF